MGLIFNIGEGTKENKKFKETHKNSGLLIECLRCGEKGFLSEKDMRSEFKAQIDHKCRLIEYRKD